MKPLLRSLLVGIAALSNPIVADAADETVSVMSFNIRYGSAKDGDNAWPHRRDLIAETIQQRSPDLLGLQEAIDFQVEHLSERLPDYAVYSVSRTPGPGGESCAIFYRKDRFEKESDGTFWLSEKPDEAGSISWDSSLPRIASWVKLRSETSGKPLLFVNTHFDHKGVVARAESAKLLRRKLPNLAGETPTIITGDFNCGEDSEPYATLTDSSEGFLDTHRIANPEQDPPNEFTFTGFGLRPGSTRIDWVLCSDQWTILEAGIDRYRSKEGRYPSDHEPVYGILKR